MHGESVLVPWIKERFVMTKFKSALASLALVFALVFSAQAKSPVPDLNLSRSGLALRGYDPVAYFTAGKPTKGLKSISTKHAGGIYYFSSDKNRKLFVQNPKKFLPAYGGYCAYGTATGVKVDGHPRIWHIVNNQLYLNITPSIDRTWQKRTGTYIKRANNNWPKIRSKR